MLDKYGLENKISIHAPAWGATEEALEELQKKEYFNPRSRVGSDVFRLLASIFA